MRAHLVCGAFLLLASACTAVSAAVFPVEHLVGSQWLQTGRIQLAEDSLVSGDG